MIHKHKEERASSPSLSTSTPYHQRNKITIAQTGLAYRLPPATRSKPLPLRDPCLPSLPSG